MQSGDNGHEEFFSKIGSDTANGEGGLKRRNRRGESAESTVPAVIDGPSNTLSSDTNVDGTRMWSASDNIFWPSKQTYTELPSGLYRCGQSDGIGPILTKQINKTDELLTLPDTVSSDIIREIQEFRLMKEAFNKRGFLHKRGIMLWGPPGSGKTSTVQLLIKLIVDQHRGIAIFLEHPSLAANCLQMVRKVELERPVIAIMEDIDALIEQHGENEYLALLDGESQVDNIVYVATTNYPERLDKRFVDRPSRFDTIKYIGMPTPQARLEFLSKKEPSYTEAELKELVNRSEGYSIAHLRELIILTRCFGMPIEKAIKRLDAFKVKQTSDRRPDAPSFGFNT